MAMIDVAIQAAAEYRKFGSVNWHRVGSSALVTFTGTAVGTGVGQGAVVVMTENPIAYQFMSRSTAILGLGSRSLTTNMLGGAIGGGVASVLIAYGGYFAGLYDLQTANRMAITGGAGALTGTAFGFGLLSLASTVGTASTGTAISSLSGAAANSAAMAWLGGGSLATGGFGTAGGLVFVTGGVVLVAFVTGAAVYAYFDYSDHQKDCKRIRLTLDHLLARQSFPMTGRGTQRFQTKTIRSE
jgi:hypothetical protein